MQRRLEAELPSRLAVMDVSIKDTEWRSVTDISIPEILATGNCSCSSCWFPVGGTEWRARPSSTFPAQPFINNSNSINSLRGSPSGPPPPLPQREGSAGDGMDGRLHAYITCLLFRKEEGEQGMEKRWEAAMEEGWSPAA